jgi:hypothetical protein
MTTENKNTQSYTQTEVNAKIMTDLKRAVMVVSLFANLTILVSWAVLAVS